MKRLVRYILVKCVYYLYKSDKDREALKVAINNDTYLGAHIDTGGHLLAELKPITEYEIISILNALKGVKNMNDGVVSSEKETYYKEKWL